jgi:hypothetical protein
MNLDTPEGATPIDLDEAEGLRSPISRGGLSWLAGNSILMHCVPLTGTIMGRC